MSVETSSGFSVTMLLMKVPPVANAKAERMDATGQLAMPGACLICVKVALPLNSGVETAWTSMLSRSPLRGGGMVVDFMIQAPAGTLRVTSACPPLELDGKRSFDFAQDDRERRFLQPTGWFGTQGCGSFAVPSFHPFPPFDALLLLSLHSRLTACEE